MTTASDCHFDSVAMFRKMLADAGKVIATLEAENAALRRKIAEMESAPR